MTLCMLLGVIVGILEWEGIWTLRSPSWVLPSLIFLMLFFTFLRISPRTLRLYPWHGVLLFFQIVVSFVIYYAILSVANWHPFDSSMDLAQGIALCVLMPAATAAPIIAGKLGGSIRQLTAFTLLSSATSAFLIPLIFPVWNPSAHIPFWSCFVVILKRVGPVLLFPAGVAWMLRFLHHRLASVRKHFLSCLVRRHPNFSTDPFISAFGEIPFWLWMGTLVILMAQISISVLDYEGSWWVMFFMILGATITTILQFFAGKYIGFYLPVSEHKSSQCTSEEDRRVSRITAGQALGQKNTTLGIWLANAYLNPLAALGPAAYIITQNVFNSSQLARVAKGKKI